MQEETNLPQLKIIQSNSYQLPPNNAADKNNRIVGITRRNQIFKIFIRKNLEHNPQTISLNRHHEKPIRHAGHQIKLSTNL